MSGGGGGGGGDGAKTGGGARIIPFTKNRQAIYDLLTRAKRFHCPISGTYEYDATDLLAAIERARTAGRAVGLTACLVRATSLVLERYPRLNHHLFHGLFRKVEVEWDEIACNLIVMREDDATRERVLFPVVIPGSNRLTLEEIHAVIKRHKEAKLDDLPQIQAMRRLERLPRLLLKYASYKIRSDPRFYRRHFGTYGLSSLVTQGFGGVAGHAVANTAASFFPGTIADRPRAVAGEVVVRKVLSVMIVADHYLLDGQDILEAMAYLRDLLERPAALGLETSTRGASGGSGEGDDLTASTRDRTIPASSPGRPPRARGLFIAPPPETEESASWRRSPLSASRGTSRRTSRRQTRSPTRSATG